MKFTAKQISDIIGGIIIGNPDESFSGFSKIEDTQENTISFIGSKKYVEYLSKCKSNVVIISKSLLPEKNSNITFIVVEDARQAFVELIRVYNSMIENKLSDISSQAVIDSTAIVGENCYIGATTVIFKNVKIGKNCQIYPQVFLGANVTIGDNTTLMPGVKIYNNCSVGSNCLLHAGVVVGSDGFGFTQENGKNVKIPQMGDVVIGNNVEIGANSAIDRAMLGSTIINDGVKIDNQVHIAHSVEIGANTIIAAQSGIAGSTKIGHNCMLGGQIGTIDHIKIGNNVKIISKSGVMHDVQDNEVMMGAPAFKYRSFLRSYACFRNLPERLKDIEDATKNNQ